MVGGIVVIGATQIEMRRSAIEQGKEYLPEAQKDWQARSAIVPKRISGIKAGDFLGTIEIPSIKRVVNIFEGTGALALSKGAGHYTQSVMPGVADNSVLSGHRDTVFFNLGKVKVGAKILITVESGSYVYQVKRIRIVSRNDRTVIVPTDNATLTLSTCYPFRFIGNAPKRYIVSAELKEATLENAITI